MPNTPDWVKHAVFYQIFPDRFARSPRVQHAAGISFKPWGSPPEEQGFQGGDLLGIVDKLDYLKELGITALYLNPIFSSASNHRYHPFDYMQVDPLLGGNEAFRELLDEAHARDMHVMIDGVFNHASRGFWPFHHILETGGNSPYIDWFIVQDWPLRPYSSDAEHPLNYAAWWNLPALPKLNTDNPGVREYIFQVAEHWIEFGADGWRLDVPFEIDDDGFWQEFRQRVKRVNPEAYICGEIWEPAPRWLQGDQFDAVMNYLFTQATLNFFGAKTLRDYNKESVQSQPLNATQFAEKIDAMHGHYDWEINHVQLNLLGSHDTARALWIMGDDPTAYKLATLFMMAMPGAPCIYYGDEIGMSAADDPHCRQAFPWDDEAFWNTDIQNHIRQATRLRHEHPALRTGSFTALHAEDEVYAFRRQLDGTDVLVVFNAGTEPATVSLSSSGSLADAYTSVWGASEGQRVEPASVEVPARDAVVGVG
ncbi:MAG: glycoside hydrolase family 13 protein [Bacteroidota bacterium]